MYQYNVAAGLDCRCEYLKTWLFNRCVAQLIYDRLRNNEFDTLQLAFQKLWVSK